MIDVVSSELSSQVEESERKSKISCSEMRQYKPHDKLVIPPLKSFVHNPLNKSNIISNMTES